MRRKRKQASYFDEDNYPAVPVPKRKRAKVEEVEDSTSVIRKRERRQQSNNPVNRTYFDQAMSSLLHVKILDKILRHDIYARRNSASSLGKAQLCNDKHI